MRRALVAFAPLLAGCPSLGAHQTADPVRPGDWALGASAVVGRANDVEQGTRVPTGQVGVGVRRGVTNDLDAGIAAYTFGVDASVKWRFARSGSFSFATLPTVGGARLRETAVTTRSDNLFLQLPVLATHHAKWPITMGAKLVWGLYRPETGGSERGTAVAAFASVDTPLGRRWHVVTEAGVLRTVKGTVPLDGFIAWVGPGFWKEW